MTTTPPSWAYHRSDWPSDTAPRWHTGPDGDQLALRLPDGVIGLCLQDAADLENLAWAEERYGALPPTWFTRPLGGAPEHCTRLYRARSGWDWRPYAVPGGRPAVVAGNEIDVWPSRHDGKPWVWASDWAPTSKGGPHPPPFDAIAWLPEKWAQHLHTEWRGTDFAVPSTVAVIRRFLDQTVVPTGNETDVLPTEQIHAAYIEWSTPWRAGLPGKPAQPSLIGRVCGERFKPWHSRTEAGFRRGFTGLRFPRTVTDA
jgi:hypothetical protein